MSWSRQGYENASYCISHTGRQPAMQRPTAPPSVPASASGVSTHRSGPKRSRSPGVWDPAAHGVGRLGAALLRDRLVARAGRAQVALVAADAFALPPLLDALQVDVRARIVGGRVRRGGVRDRLDERRPAAVAR